MSRIPRPKLTYANVVATIALIIAVGGGAAIAANSLPKNSVKAKQIAKEAVKTSKLAKDAATGDKVKEATLGKVPLAGRADSAGTADTATNAAHANVADALGGQGTSVTPAKLAQVQNVSGRFNQRLELDLRKEKWGRFWLGCKQNDTGSNFDDVVTFNYSDAQGPAAIDSGFIAANEFPLGAVDVFPIDNFTSDAGSLEYGTQGRRLYVHYISATIGTSKTLEITGGGFDDEGTAGCIGQLHASVSG